MNYIINLSIYVVACKASGQELVGLGLSRAKGICVFSDLYGRAGLTLTSERAFILIESCWSNFGSIHRTKVTSADRSRAELIFSVAIRIANLFFVSTACHVNCTALWQSSSRLFALQSHSARKQVALLRRQATKTSSLFVQFPRTSL